MLELAGRGMIVAGTRRLGAVVVERLAREGIRPAIVYRRSKTEAESLADSVRTLVDRVHLVQADLAVEDDVRRAVAAARGALGDLSFCVNLASDFPRVPFEKLDAAAWEAGIAPAKGAFLFALHAARAMQLNPGPTRGHIVFFGDWAAEHTPYPDFLPYLTAKAAVHFMTRAFAVELAPSGILVNAVLPGPTAWDPQLVSADEWQQALDAAPLHRESSAEEMAELLVTLLKLECMTGEQVRIDSGRHVVGTGVPKDRQGR